MSSHFRMLMLALVVSLAATPAVRAQGTDDDPAAKVRKAIDDGVGYLKSHQKDGNWETHQPLLKATYKGGVTCLVMLALLESGVDPSDQVIQDGLKYVRDLEPRSTYVVSLQTMVLAHGEPEKDKVLIKRNVEWLLAAMHRKQDGDVLGWSYEKGGGDPDNSNSQYAVLGLREASVAGVKIDVNDWKAIEKFYKDTQKDGGWGYKPFGGGGASTTMTAAGVCGLIISGMELHNVQGREELDPFKGAKSGCGKYETNEALEKGMEALGGRYYNISSNQWHFYNLYGIERAGRLSGQRFLGEHDWYRDGVDMLVYGKGGGNKQAPEGYWESHSPADGGRMVATAFSLLFLAKGRTPVLIHKMVHGKVPALNAKDRGERGLSGDWNNDRNDVRNLTEFASQKVFQKKVPLTWQVFDASRSPGRGPEKLKALLQAPILFINGHNDPYFTGDEMILLRDYVDQGGFVFAEACCGKDEFKNGFRDKAMKIWGRDLEDLPEGHPVWTAFAGVPPGSFKLQGITFGCRTGVIFSPEDMSCYWESNQFEDKMGDPIAERSLLAFRMGGNIIAYATGLEPPQPKGTRIQVVTAKETKPARNDLEIAQLDYGGKDWQPAPRAMVNLKDHLNKNWNLDIAQQAGPDGAPKTKPITLGDPGLPNYKILYMHGRRKFTFEQGPREALRKHLETGGFLLADACCGSKEFDESFRKMVQDTFGRPLQPVPLDDPFFSDKIGKKIEEVQCRTKPGTKHSSMKPELEGVRLYPDDPRSPWILIYSKWDLGCALDKHNTSDCLGHDHPSALLIAAQAVLYALKE